MRSMVLMMVLALAGLPALGQHAQVVRWSAPEEQELVKAPYLGVSTSPVEETLGDQLKLPAGVGLVVDYVDPESPAAGKLEAHDVLYAFNGQLLVMHYQLAVLVRTNQPGDEVSMKIMRKGEALDITTELVEKELPKLQRPSWQTPRVQFGEPLWQSVTNFPGFQDLRLQRQGGGQLRQGNPQIRGIHMGGPGTTHHFKINLGGTSQQSVTMANGDHSLSLATDDNGVETLTATDADGNVVFEGPVNTDEQLNEVPAEIRDQLQELKGLNTGVKIRIAPQKVEELAR